jgi:exonuclease SbcD
VLETLTEQVRTHAVDVVVVAGDVFDSATPAAACYTLLSETLRALADTGAQVIVTSGNHDSAARLGFQAALLRDGIHVRTDPTAIGEPITVSDEHGPVHFYGIPFLEPALVRAVWPGVRTQADALGRAMDLVRADHASRGGRTVAIAHCFAAGVEPTPHLERDIQQGGLDVVPLSAFDGVDYVALGTSTAARSSRRMCATPVRRCTTASVKGTSRAGRGSSIWMPRERRGGVARAAGASTPRHPARAVRGDPGRPRPTTPATHGSASSTPMIFRCAIRCVGCSSAFRTAQGRARAGRRAPQRWAGLHRSCPRPHAATSSCSMRSCHMCVTARG